MDRTMAAAPRGARRALLLMTLSTLLGAVPAASAKPAWTSGTYVYADLCTDADGARAGHRITLRRSPNGDGLTYEGARLPGPVRAGTIAVDDATRTIVFDVETPSGPLAFRGTLGPDALPAPSTTRWARARCACPACCAHARTRPAAGRRRGRSVGRVDRTGCRPG